MSARDSGGVEERDKPRAIYDVTPLLSAIETLVSSQAVSSYLARRSGAWERDGRVYVDYNGLRVILDYASSYEAPLRRLMGRRPVELVVPVGEEARRRLEALSDAPGSAARTARDSSRLAGGVAGTALPKAGWPVSLERGGDLIDSLIDGRTPAWSGSAIFEGGLDNLRALVSEVEVASSGKAPAVVVVYAYDHSTTTTYTFYLKIASGKVVAAKAVMVPGDAAHGLDAIKALTRIRGLVIIKVYIIS